MAAFAPIGANEEVTLSKRHARQVRSPRRLFQNNCTAYRPRDFLNEDEAVRVASLGIDDELSAIEVMEAPGLPLVGAAHWLHGFGGLENLTGLHLLGAVAADSAERIIGVT